MGVPSGNIVQIAGRKEGDKSGQRRGDRETVGRKAVTEGALWKLEGAEARCCRDRSLYMLLRELQTKIVLSALVLELPNRHCTFY